MLGADGGIPDIVEDLGGEGRAGKKERKKEKRERRGRKSGG